MTSCDRWFRSIRYCGPLIIWAKRGSGPVMRLLSGWANAQVCAMPASVSASFACSASSWMATTSAGDNAGSGACRSAAQRVRRHDKESQCECRRAHDRLFPGPLNGFVEGHDLGHVDALGAVGPSPTSRTARLGRGARNPRSRARGRRAGTARAGRRSPARRRAGTSRPDEAAARAKHAGELRGRALAHGPRQLVEQIDAAHEIEARIGKRQRFRGALPSSTHDQAPSSRRARRR